MVKLIKKHKFNKEFKIFKKTDNQRFSVKSKDQYPCLNDKDMATSFDKHYVYHSAWAARKLKDISPKKHIDISSFTYFATLVSAFIPIDFYEYNPTKIDLDNLTHKYADLTRLPFDDNVVDCLSCMHVVEHIGLGRYSDAIDVDGDLKAISELKRVVAKGGYLLFVVPIGGQAKVMFNAHRIYNYRQIISYFKEFELVEFSPIPDQLEQGIIINATEEQSNQKKYGCGCFLLQKNG